MQEEKTPTETLFILAVLVDASLVQVSIPEVGPARFGMFELLRDYALQRLMQRGKKNYANGDTQFIMLACLRMLPQRYQNKEYKKRSCSRKFPMSVQQYSGP